MGLDLKQFRGDPHAGLRSTLGSLETFPLPAAMNPLGDGDWYLRHSLRRLPRVGGEQEARPAEA